MENVARLARQGRRTARNWTRARRTRVDRAHSGRDVARQGKKLSDQIDLAARSQNAALLPRLLVERRRRHARQDGAHAQRLRPGAGRKRRATNASSASDSTSPAPSPSADFYAGKPERKKRWISWESPSSRPPAAAGDWRAKASCRCSAPTPRFPRRVISTRFAFPSATPNFNVLIAGAHAGVSVGPDGATHQALEDLFAMMGLPNMTVVVPCDIDRNAQGNDTSATRACWPQIHSLRARSHAHRHG
jgi:hypothetical protein